MVSVRCAISIVLTILTGTAAAAQDARTLAKAAYERIKAHPFEASELQAADNDISRAHLLDPEEAYVWLAGGVLLKTVAYQSGDWTDARSFDSEMLAKALDLIERAVAADERLTDPHLELAWLAIIQRDLPRAHHEYFVAHQLEPEDFDVWYGQAVCWWKQGNGQKSRTAFAGAESRARTVADRITLNVHRQRMARSRSDFPEVERILKEDIGLQPGSRWAHGNYGLFLMERGRLAEAVAEYERAVALGSYPLAEAQLATARQKLRVSRQSTEQ